MKKVFAVLLCLVMCLSSVSVLAYKDYNDVPEEYIKVTDLLYELEIMEGFEDGDFKPEDTLTRAEATAIMVRLIGLENDAEQGETAFCDVPQTHWASGYVNVAHANGIIHGIDENTFDPEGLVTYHQFVKMLVCLLGYESAAQANGGWNDGGYLYLGSRLGFTKGVDGTANDVITRMTAARLTYNALEVDIFVEEIYGCTGINTSGPYEAAPSKCILTEYLGCEKIHGVITNCDNGIEVIVTKNIYDDYEVNYGAGEKVVFTDKTRNAKNFIGYTIIAYVRKSDEGDLFLVTDEKAGKNHLTVIPTDLIEEFTNEKVVYYKSEISKNTTEAAMESFVRINSKENVEVSCNVIVNGVLDPDFDVYKEYKNIDEITFLDNDDDGDFEFIIVNTEK